MLTSAVIGTGGDTIDLAKSGSLTPTIIGTTTSGIGTYTSQLGEFYVMGKIVFYEIELVWTAHTGTGNMRIEGLPYTSKSNDIFVPSAVYWSNLTLLAVGNKVLAIVMPNTTKISIYEIGNGASSVLPMDAAGSLRVSGFYIRA